MNVNKNPHVDWSKIDAYMNPDNLPLTKRQIRVRRQKYKDVERAIWGCGDVPLDLDKYLVKK